ncbi:MAG TPA: hypothetical protein VKQ31_09535 [Steroidobacteraceae bacterium]|nr:hypothetical protein [Steroidobacteraceae bacterium]
MSRVALAALAMLPLIFVAAADAAPLAEVRVVRTDLEPLIRAAADSAVQFAVPVALSASTADAGSWSIEGDRAIWRYAVQVPTAVSLSFHALGASLPDSATLLVTGAGAAASYRASDLRGELWSRVYAGDTVELTLTVAAADRANVALRIVGLQAGYRSIGAGVADHPVYRRMRASAGSSDNSGCVTNYACKVDAGNAAAAAATVALVVANLYQCTGTLINDAPGDNTPYVLTARHCETGRLGGGDPGAAAAVTVYWNAVSACGTALGSIYDGTLVSQTGARTVVEQQDAWLIRLDDNPAVADAQFAGFDASGARFEGGYTIQQAGGLAKQFVSWFGTAFVLTEYDALGTRYVSNFLDTVNQIGNIGPGASGSGFFNSNDRLVGTLSLGRTSTSSSGYGTCPVTPLAEPNGSNGVADFTALAAVWSSLADRTSTTGNATLKSLLDPAGTGTRIVPSMPVTLVAVGATPPPAPRISFDPGTDIRAGQTFNAQWSATNAASCTLTGGIPGGAWGASDQSFPASGSLTESGPAGHYTFGLVCQSVEAGGAPVAAQATLTIAAAAAAFAPSSSLAPQAGGIGAGGGGALGVLEAAVLVALLALHHLRRTQSRLTQRSTRRPPARVRGALLDSFRDRR